MLDPSLPVGASFRAETGDVLVAAFQ